MHCLINHFNAKIMNDGLKSSVLQENDFKMTLRDYYYGLPETISPKTEFIGKVMERTGASYTSVRNWIVYGMKPKKQSSLKALSEITGIPVENLWSK